MEHIKETIKKKNMRAECQCPKCKSDAYRVLKEGRYYIYCPTCQYDGLARLTIKEEINQAYE